MLEKTRGIVINYIKLRETSIVVNIYTEAFGIRSYIENGIRSAKSKNKIALFQPLTILELVVFEREGKGLKRISEVKCSQPFQTLPYDIAKSSIALFLAEVLKKCLKEEESNPPLFNFLLYSLSYLDEPHLEFGNFHLIFLSKLSTYLGFSPETADQVLAEFQAINLRPFNTELIVAFNQILKLTYEDTFKITRVQRADLLDIILSFYKIHVDGFGEIKSHLVLKEVLG
ncbi:MAG: DNA repair protein RecO [Bacteroidota bacterium]